MHAEHDSRQPLYVFVCAGRGCVFVCVREHTHILVCARAHMPAYVCAWERKCQPLFVFRLVFPTRPLK